MVKSHFIYFNGFAVDSDELICGHGDKIPFDFSSRITIDKFKYSSRLQFSISVYSLAGYTFSDVVVRVLTSCGYSFCHPCTAVCFTQNEEFFIIVMVTDNG